MSYSAIQKSKIKKAILEKVSEKLNVADDEMLDQLMKQFGVYLGEEETYVTRQMKILVLGTLAGKVNDYKIAAKRMNISENNIEFESDYAKLTGFNTERLRNSFVYSDIIYGPTPHKMMNTDGFSSAFAKMSAEPTSYPRVIKATANSALKISINSFKDALSKTRLIQIFNS